MTTTSRCDRSPAHPSAPKPTVVDGALRAHAFRAMNTEWWIGTSAGDAASLRSLEALVRGAEARYSRFQIGRAHV